MVAHLTPFSNTWTSPQPKPIRGVDQTSRRRANKAALDAAYAEVDLRDGPYCRVTGRYTQPGAVDARVRREHHHLAERSTSPELKYDPRNIVVICAEAHRLFKAGWLVSEGDDATGTVRFHWTSLAPAVKPFHIKSRRWSQEDEL